MLRAMTGMVRVLMPELPLKERRRLGLRREADSERVG